MAESTKMSGCCGVHAVHALLSAQPQLITTVYLQATGAQSQNARLAAIGELAQSLSVHCVRVADTELDALVGNRFHQGVYACYRPLQMAWQDLLQKLDASSLLLVLDGVQDPHNLGACMRTAWAVGVQAVIAPKDQSVGLTPTVHKVACGGAACVPYIPVTNLATAMRQLKQKGVWLYGAAESAETGLYTLDCKRPVAMVLGAEGRGLRALTQRHCDQTFHIPTQSDFSTLNVSVAAGVCLFEVRRQRH